MATKFARRSSTVELDLDYMTSSDCCSVFNTRARRGVKQNQPTKQNQTSSPHVSASDEYYYYGYRWQI